MSETKHSPEPWTRGEEHECKIEIVDANGAEVGRVHGGIFAPRAAMEERYRRIVACVNACAGIPTEALEAGRLGQVLDLAEVAADEEHLQVLAGALAALGRLP